MKHFWVFTFVSIIITAFFGGFAFPERSFAQNTVTVEQILQHTSAIFDEKLLALNNEISLYPNNYGGRGTPTFITYQETNTSMLAAVRKARTKFEETLAAQTPNRTPQQLYGDALLAASLSLVGQRTASPILQRTEASNFIDKFRTELMTEVTSQERIRAITTGQALSAEARANAAASIGAASPSTKPVDGQCKWNNFTISACLSEGLTWLVKNILLEIVGFFLWMSANLLNFAMYHGVFEFKKFAPDDIYNIWLVVRQIISLFVFFTGLFVGFMAIIGKSEEFKKYIAFLVVFGLFVNFSYPIVRVFVDVSNVVSLQIYQTALGKEVLADNPGAGNNAGEKIMTSLGLQGLAASATSLPTAGNKNGFIDQVTSLPGALAVVGFVGYAAYIFFMAAFLIIIRTALLVCIIIASPILLVDTIVPALGEKAKWLRGMFVSQLFVAPVFTIMLALTLKFLAIFSANNTNPSALSSAGTSSVAVFFNLIMMLVMLHIMLKVTKAVAGGVGDTVTNWAGKAGGLGTGLALGAGAATFGFATRNTVGRFAKNMGDKDFGGGVLGNLTKDAFKGMGGAKYDLRNLGATGAIAGTLGITGMGKGADKGYDKNREEYEKETYERASEIKDDGEREGYLKRKFNTSNFAKFTGTASQNAKAYSKFIKEDDDVIKQYVNSDEDGRKKLSESEKNTKFLQRFGNVDKYYDSRTTEEEKNMLKARMSVSTQKAVEEKSQQDDGTVESYINANETQRARMAANAKNKNLKARFEDVDKYYDTTATPEDRATIRGRIGTDDKRALDDNDKRLAEKEADRVIKTAQLSAAQATKATTAALVEQNVSTSQQTNSILNQMVAGNNDIADLLRTMIKTSKATTTQTTNLPGGALVGNSSDSLYQKNNEGDSENILTPQLSPKKEAVPAE